MQLLLLLVTLVVLASVASGMIRVFQGPTAADRMLAGLLLGSGGVAVLLLLGNLMAMPALHDVALVFVVLTTGTTAAFVRLGWNPESDTTEEPSR